MLIGDVGICNIIHQNKQLRLVHSELHSLYISNWYLYFVDYKNIWQSWLEKANVDTALLIARGVETGGSGGSVNKDPQTAEGPQGGDTKIRQENTSFTIMFKKHQISWQLGLCLRPHSAFCGICEAHFHQLQSVLNAVARLIIGKRKYDHIASTMHEDLHWLPVRQCILFKLCSPVSKCLHRTIPSYLTDLCIPVSSTTARSCLRSVFTRCPDDPTLSTVTLWIMEICCLWSCSLELSTSSHLSLIFIIIPFLQPSQNWTFLHSVWH